MSKTNAHTYSEKLRQLWMQMGSTVQYIVAEHGRDWTRANCNSKLIEISPTDADKGCPTIVRFVGTADDCVREVDALVLKGLRKTHNDPNYTI